MVIRAEAVQRHIPVYHCHGAGAAVYGIYMDGTACKGVNGEAAGIAEEVKHVSAFGKGANPCAVFPLVQEKARLLAFVPVDKELVAVFKDNSFVLLKTRGLPKIPVHKIQAGLEGRSAGTLVIDSLERRSVNLPEGIGDGVFSAEHAHRMGLQHAHPVIEVHYEPGQAVPFPVHKTVAVGAVFSKPKGFPEPKCP